jgi:hypothetical protein
LLLAVILLTSSCGDLAGALGEALSLGTTATHGPAPSVPQPVAQTGSRHLVVSGLHDGRQRDGQATLTTAPGMSGGDAGAAVIAGAPHQPRLAQGGFEAARAPPIV